MSKKLEKDKLRYVFAYPESIIEVALAIIKKHGLRALSGKSMSDIDILRVSLDDPTKLINHFSGSKRIVLSTIEALSLAYVSKYYQHLVSNGTEYLIGVNVEDKLQTQTERELYLSDGALATYRSGKLDNVMPFQQVMAQNVVGKSVASSIEEEIIKQTTNKIAKRDAYNNISGLIVSVVANGGFVDIKKIIDKCDIEAFDPIFLLNYEENFDKCTVIHIRSDLRSLNDLQKNSLRIRANFN